MCGAISSNCLFIKLGRYFIGTVLPKTWVGGALSCGQQKDTREGAMGRQDWPTTASRKPLRFPGLKQECVWNLHPGTNEQGQRKMGGPPAKKDGGLDWGGSC
jgi:hypothetical protein